MRSSAGQPDEQREQPSSSACRAVAEDEMAVLTCPNCAVRVQPEVFDLFPVSHQPAPLRVSERGSAHADGLAEYLSADYQQACPTAGPGSRIHPTCVVPGMPAPAAGDRPAPYLTVVLRIAFPTGNIEIPGRHVAAAGPGPGAVAGGRGLRPLRQRVPSARHGHRRRLRPGDDPEQGCSADGTFVNDDRAIPGTEVSWSTGPGFGSALMFTGDLSCHEQEMDPANLQPQQRQRLSSIIGAATPRAAVAASRDHRGLPGGGGRRS